MEKSKLASKYELVLIIDAKVSGETKETIRKEATDLINKHGGKVINSQLWLEKHKLTFRIKKCDEGTYYIINFEGGSDVVAKVKPILQINEKILRFVFINIGSKSQFKGVAEVARV